MFTVCFGRCAVANMCNFVSFSHGSASLTSIQLSVEVDPDSQIGRFTAKWHIKVQEMTNSIHISQN